MHMYIFPTKIKNDFQAYNKQYNVNVTKFRTQFNAFAV